MAWAMAALFYFSPFEKGIIMEILQEGRHGVRYVDVKKARCLSGPEEFRAEQFKTCDIYAFRLLEKRGYYQVPLYESAKVACSLCAKTKVLPPLTHRRHCER